MALPQQVNIVEVGPRDGLQNEPEPISVATRIELVEKLGRAGLSTIETGSFVNPKWIPQMASSEEVFAGISRRPGVRYAALTPNMQGFERALAAGADEVAVFAAASEAFSQKNINCSISESLARFEPLMGAAAAAEIPVRGYVSCVVGCPYEGAIAPESVSQLSQTLLGMGCYEVSLGDTIGVGTAGSISALLEELLANIPAQQLALHCHDTYGQALANILVGLQHGIATIDASVSGLGGCPYAKGASGNVATEDVVYMLHGMSIDTGVDLPLLIQAGNYISEQLGRNSDSRAARALSS
ncbi:MAG: hydroxymethylglutaryl-CoA lyase [Halieaceae bacterium]